MTTIEDTIHSVDSTIWRPTNEDVDYNKVVPRDEYCIEISVPRYMVMAYYTEFYKYMSIDDFCVAWALHYICSNAKNHVRQEEWMMPRPAHLACVTFNDVYTGEPGEAKWFLVRVGAIKKKVCLTIVGVDRLIPGSIYFPFGTAPATASNNRSRHTKTVEEFLICLCIAQYLMMLDRAGGRRVKRTLGLSDAKNILELLERLKRDVWHSLSKYHRRVWEILHGNVPQDSPISLKNGLLICPKILSHPLRKEPHIALADNIEDMLPISKEYWMSMGSLSRIFETLDARGLLE
jgi:hypothetical protein